MKSFDQKYAEKIQNIFIRTPVGRILHRYKDKIYHMYLLLTKRNHQGILKSVCFQITVARSSVDSILWSCYVMIGFITTTNLSQLKIAQLPSTNKWTLIKLFLAHSGSYKFFERPYCHIQPKNKTKLTLLLGCHIYPSSKRPV